MYTYTYIYVCIIHMYVNYQLIGKIMQEIENQLKISAKTKIIDY
jgi:hypothetical protein